MKGWMIGFMAMGLTGLLSGCAASAAAEDGVADHKNHADRYVQSPLNNGSVVATKLAPTASTAPAVHATHKISAVSASPAAPSAPAKPK
jgi:hypothetical protein